MVCNRIVCRWMMYSQTVCRNINSKIFILPGEKHAHVCVPLGRKFNFYQEMKGNRLMQHGAVLAQQSTVYNVAQQYSCTAICIIFQQEKPKWEKNRTVSLLSVYLSGLEHQWSQGWEAESHCASQKRGQIKIMQSMCGWWGYVLCIVPEQHQKEERVTHIWVFCAFRNLEKGLQ